MFKSISDAIVFKNRPDASARAEEKRIEILSNPIVERMCLEHMLTDRQIDNSMNAFLTYISQKEKLKADPLNEYDVELFFMKEYGYVIANLVTTEAMKNRKLEHDTSDKLKRESILSDKRIEKATFETFIPQGAKELEALKFAQEAANDYRFGKTGNLLMTGKAGTGKSHLAMSIIEYLNSTFRNDGKYKTALFVSVVELFELMKESFDEEEGKYSTKRMRDILSNADYLVLDDLGAETGKDRNGNVKRASDWCEKFLSMVLEARETTIFTTNYNGEELTKMYGQRLVSRIFEGSYGNTFIFEGIKDKRRRINEI